VLHDAYTKLGQEERQALLHEGLATGVDQPTSSTAFVEIIFDNSDQRFPTGNDTVTIRRTISMSQDEFLLDGKAVTKSDITNLLQSAGFSKSNPYYIVPQGRITALTNAKDADRLQLLKEVAGTKVYEEHREESMKIMEETEQKKSKIDELLSSINEKIQKLEKEKQDLLKYQELDKKKRCLEYNILKNEQNEIDLAIANFEKASKMDLDSSEKIQRDYTEREGKITELQNELSTLEQEAQILAVEHEHICRENESQLGEVRKIERSLASIADEKQNSHKQEQILNKELAALEKSILDASEKLQSLESQNASMESEEQNLKKELDVLKAQRDVLQVKQGRSRQFNSAKERDAFLHGEISSLKKRYDFETKRKEELNVQLDQLRSDLDIKSGSLDSLQEHSSRLQNDIDTLELQLLEESRNKERLVEQRKQLWREENKLASIVPTVQEEVLKHERHIYGTLDKNTIQGLEAVRSITRCLGLEYAVYGPVYELFTTDPLYYTCVEMVAGNSLFHVVVENDEVATQILTEMVRMKSGRVTFMPLNRLRPEVPKQRPTNHADSSPMLEILDYDQKYAAAFEQLFGRAWIVSSLEVGSTLSKQYGVNAITLDGDRIDRKGALTGGFLDTKRARLASAAQAKSLIDKLNTYESHLEHIKQQLKRLDQEITLRSGQLQVKEAELAKAQRSFESLQKDLLIAREQLATLTASLLDKQKQIAAIDSVTLSDKIGNLEAEIGTPLVQKLSPKEANQLQQMEARCHEVAGILLKRTNARTADLVSQISTLKNSLSENYCKRVGQIQAELVSLRKAARKDSSVELDAHLVNLNERLAVSQKAEQSISLKIKQLKETKESKKQQVEALKAAQEKQAPTLQTAELQLTKLTTKKAGLMERQLAIQKRFSLLGLIPEEAHKYGRLSGADLLTELHATNEHLKAYAHVNKKAFEQSHAYLKERAALLSRKADLDSSAKSIQQFIAHLDHQKDEAVVRTFEQVSRYFVHLFSRLVPNGSAKLVIQRSLSSTSGTDPDTSSLAAFTGIGIEVVLNGSQMRMQQLSGGQKSIVALALIFAIQKCDPAPFYLFDEIDANLDEGHRKAVAALLTEMKQHVGNEYSEGHAAQFLTTTFRPEMLLHADKFYGVTFANRVSRVQVISKDTAMEFIQQD
jgi:structural maintenance of chromosome 3 (chondroitin sulfate proteoglycan 6)